MTNSIVLSNKAKEAAVEHFLSYIGDENAHQVYDILVDNPDALECYIIWKPFENYDYGKIVEWLQNLAVTFQEAMDSVK